MVNWLLSLFDNVAGGIMDFFASLVPSSFIQIYFLENQDEFEQAVDVFSHVNYFLPVRNIASFVLAFSTFAVGYVVFRLVYTFFKGKILK